MAKQYDFDVSVSTDRLLAMYRGDKQYLVVTSNQGLVLQLPLSNFRPFVTADGLYGNFSVSVDDNNKLLKLKRSN